MQIAVLGVFTVAMLTIDHPAIATEKPVYDVVVYGGTSSTVVAAVQVKKMGKIVVVVGPDKYLEDAKRVGMNKTK